MDGKVPFLDNDDQDYFASLRRQYEDFIRKTWPGGHGTVETRISTWLPMAKAILESCASGSPSSMIGPSLDLLLAFIGVEDEQAQLLQSIDKQVSVLRAGPFTAGRLLIQEAAQLRGNLDKSREFLEEAQLRFFDAHGLALSPIERGVVELNLGVTWLLLGGVEDSGRWFATSHASMLEGAQQLVATANDVRVLKSRLGVMNAALSITTLPYGYVILAKKALKVRKSQLALQQLIQLMPILNASAQAAAAVGRPGIVGYDLTINQDSYGLVAMDTYHIGS